MARILYGLCGEGSGHATRARVVLRHLAARGHALRIASFDRGASDLRPEFEVFEIEGLRLSATDNRVSRLGTLRENLGRLKGGARRLRAFRRECFEAFRPELVLCDFEPQTAWLARELRLPLLSIDNQHLVRCLEHPDVPGLGREARLLRALVKLIVPQRARSIVTSFWPGRVLDARAVRVPPILREEVLALEPTRGEHVVVYFTRGFESFLAGLATLPEVRFRVYGAGREGRQANLEFRAPSGPGFRADLASARAVLATAGFGLIGEALFLGKPYLALPMRGQYEQELNAHHLELLGYGRNARAWTRETVGDFLFRLPQYEAALAGYPRSDNRALLKAVDAAVRELAH